MRNMILGTALLFLVAVPAFSQKQKITSAEQLPRRTVALEGKVADIYNNDALLEKIAKELYQNFLNDMKVFEITDKSTLISYESSLMQLEFLLGDYSKIPARLERIRGIEDREEDKLTTGLTMYAQLAALEKYPINSQEYFQEFSKNYSAALAKLPYDKVEQFVINRINSLRMFNADIILPSLETQLQPFIDNGKGQVMEQIAGAIVVNKAAAKNNHPLVPEMLRKLEAYQKQNTENKEKRKKQNIWAEREVALKKNAGTEVVVAIWDTGVDTKLFPGQLWTNPKEKRNGKDDDNNGFIDDLHGIAFDTENRRTAGDLIPPQNLTYPEAQLLAWTKGSMDLQQGIMSEEAQALQQKAATLKPEEAKAFQEDLGWYGVYAHGTHVAGIAAEGNPQIRLLYTRVSYETTITPSAPTEEKHQNTLKMYADQVAYWKAAGVKVVNISLRFTPAMFEGLLNMHGIGKDQEERKAIAMRWFNAEKKALEDAMRNAPDILFVCAAGNEANDADFANYYPASLTLPNLITIGAVDAEGKKTSFTTEGKNIKLFANGYEVESFVPGGTRVNFNGTSMASPQVVNLAAKMLVVNPELKPTQIKEILYETSTVSAENANIRLIHPRNAVEAAAKLRKDYKNNLLDKLLVSAK